MALTMAPDVVEIALEPKTSADQERLDLALTRLAAENPSFHFTTDHESGQTIIKGTSERDLENFVDRITRETRDTRMIVAMNHAAILRPSGRSYMLTTVV